MSTVGVGSLDAMKPASEILAGIRESIQEAATAFDNFISANAPRNSGYREEQEGIFCYFFDQAFLELRLFLEAKGLSQMLQALTGDRRRFHESGYGSLG
jgi:hypothetical protein